MTIPTQIARPWRTTIRTLFQGIVAAAAVAAPVYEAAVHQDAAAATGWAATGLAVAAAVTRVMALPAVDTFLARFLPFLAAQPAPPPPDPGV